jgi:hypothetical protein
MVCKGDIILMKKPGGPICGVAVVAGAKFFDLRRQSIAQIREKYNSAICAGDDFWKRRQSALYATLIDLAEPVAIADFPFKKRDRRAWVALTPLQMRLVL